MSNSQITTHVADGVARLHSFDENQTNTVALLSALLAPVQDTENALWQLLVERGVDSAVGVQLTTLGAIVGQPRNGLADDVYRRYIRARIRTNSSAGVPSDLIKIARLVLGDLEAEIVVRPEYPAALVVQLSPATTDEVATVVSVLLQQAKSAGVRLLMEFSEAAYQDTFHFAETSTFLTISDPGGSTTLTVTNTTGWSASGSLFIDLGTSVTEFLPYTAITATTITCSSTSNAHAVNAAVIPYIVSAPFTDYGWGDSADPGVGGVHAGAKGP